MRPASECASRYCSPATGATPGQVGGRSPYLQAVHATGPATLIGTEAMVTIEAMLTNSLTGTLSGAGTLLRERACA